MYVVYFSYSISLISHVHRYQHSRQLVNALNQFADLNAELPEGWEKKLNREGKVLFAVI